MHYTDQEGLIAACPHLQYCVIGQLLKQLASIITVKGGHVKHLKHSVQHNHFSINHHNTLIRIMELSFPCTFAPGSERSIGGTFAPWNFPSMELLYPGTFAPQHELSVIHTHFEKALDKVPHNRLISKLGSYMYGIDNGLEHFYCIGNIVLE